MRERRLFWDAEGRRRSRNPYEKSTLPWIDDRPTRRFLAEYVLRHQPKRWQESLVKLGVISPDYLRRHRTHR